MITVDSKTNEVVKIENPGGDKILDLGKIIRDIVKEELDKREKEELEEFEIDPAEEDWGDEDWEDEYDGVDNEDLPTQEPPETKKVKDDKYIPENGYYEFEHYLDPTDAPGNSVAMIGPNGRLFWFANPRNGYYPWDSEDIPDGSVPVIKDGKKQWYYAPEMGR